VSKLIDFWNRLFRQPALFSSPRRMFLVLAVIGIVLTGYWLFTYARAPEPVSLTDRPLSGSELSKAATCLSQWGQTYRIRGSYILVEPARQADLLARMDFLSNQSESEASGYSDLLKGGIFLSESERQQRFKLSQESALAAQIRNFRGLKAARVFLANPARTGFGSTSTEPAASVIVWTSDDQPLEPDLAQAIRQTIAGTISGMVPQNVHVIDAGSGCYLPAVSPAVAGSSDNAQSAGTISRLSNLQRQAEKIESQWEQKIQDKLSYIPELLVSVHIDPQSLLTAAQKANGDATTSASDTPEPDISVSLNIPRSYLLSLCRQRNSLATEPTDADLQPTAAEQIAKITAVVKAIIGRPTSSYVYVDWYYDNPSVGSLALADSAGSAYVAKPPTFFSRWLQPAYIAAGIAMISLLALLAVFVRRLTGPDRRQRAIALARLDAERPYLDYTLSQPSTERSGLALKSLSYCGPADPEVSAFEELLKLDDATFRGLLARTEPQILALALRTASDKLRRRILADLPAECRQAVHGHPDFLSPVRLSDIEAAQQEMVDLLEVPERIDSELVASASESAT